MDQQQQVSQTQQMGKVPHAVQVNQDPQDIICQRHATVEKTK